MAKIGNPERTLFNDDETRQTSTERQARASAFHDRRVFQRIVDDANADARSQPERGEAVDAEFGQIHRYDRYFLPFERVGERHLAFPVSGAASWAPSLYFILVV